MASKNKYWFDKNNAKFTFFATVISALALIFSAIVLLVTTKENKKNYELSNAQYEAMLFYSKRQLDNTDSLFNISLVNSNLESIHQDSLFIKQLKVFDYSTPQKSDSKLRYNFNNKTCKNEYNTET